MRLYLSSENVGNHTGRLKELVGDNLTVAYISNAKDYSDEERTLKIPKHQAEFEARGFNFKEFDLRKYVGKSAELEQEVSKFGLVFASGGNTFLLRRAMYDSGFDEILVRLLQRDQFVYGGSSAGSIVVSPSLRGYEIGDDPDATKVIYGKEIIWDGLGLIDFYLSVHYDSDWFGEEAEEVARYFISNKLPYKILRDGQVWVVDGDKQELLP